MTINLTPFLFLIAGVSINPKSATTPPPAILPIAANPALSLASFASVIPCDVEALFCVVGLKYTKCLGEPRYLENSDKGCQYNNGLLCLIYFPSSWGAPSSSVTVEEASPAPS
ncbi:uncharacterized protein K441DRAFT_660503 [Cenococcum geophilum 1.58]|uniref:uncharacterized protein n=1 Tax=Cenococcum geophilum 1.58 TaxID=794803 RepID=UPI00358E4F00|nr:hypothetical protein K441DRAFT_660503 [Cenococcum geophilum 1.58]